MIRLIRKLFVRVCTIQRFVNSILSNPEPSSWKSRVPRLSEQQNRSGLGRSDCKA